MQMGCHLTTIPQAIDHSKSDKNMDNDSIFSDDWPEDHRSGVVAVVGRPNVGKSTLVNSIMGQKIAIATPKPQTTRRQQLGIYTQADAQALFVDTPGLHKPHNKLGEYMLTVAEQSLRDGDVVLWILDASEPPRDADKIIAETIRNAVKDAPVVLVLNKMDTTSKKVDLTAHRNLIAYHSVFEVSALTGDQVPELTQHLLSLLPLGPRYYPMDQVSDVNMRFIAAEMVREKVILNTEQEIPHSVAVAIDGYREGDERTEIEATIYVERDSQKGIVIGKGGQMIKIIGTQARQELMTMLERPVHLDLHVKVLKNWRSNEQLMRRMGYRLPKEDDDK